MSVSIVNASYPCERCDGRGWVTIVSAQEAEWASRDDAAGNDCPDCDGTGRA